MLLFQEVLTEVGTWCRTSTSRDLKTVSARVECEGLSFLTISLPKFGSDLQKGLDQGFVDHDLFKGFTFTGGLPRLFGGFLDHIFDRGTGRLLDSPSVTAIHAIRQLTLMFAKINIPCSQEREKAAMDAYIECEKQVKKYDSLRTTQEIEEFHRVSVLLWAEIFSKVDENIYYSRVRPKHGPGATADRLKGNQKYDQVEWTDRLERVFPAGEFLLPNWKHLDKLNDLNWLEPGAERPVRVITVPKTLKAPRIIAIEPTCMQYAQQAIWEDINENVQRNDTLRTFIGFEDQEPNRVLAQQASEFRNLATLDLSEASDRVSNQLVRTLLRNHPHLSEAVDACRSRKADVAGHGVIRLAKFASMGSALCFPMEAMVFLTLIFLGIQDELRRPLTLKDIESFKGKVRVFGDDIIVPVDYVRSVVNRLETFGSKVNVGKSFWTGSFRESCGRDYYDGHDVSIVRVRRLLPTQLSDASEIVSTVSLYNQLYKRGFWKTCMYLDQQVIGKLIDFPAVGPESPVLGKHLFTGYQYGKMCSDLQRPLVKGYVVRTVTPVSKLDGTGALLKFFLKRGIEPNPSKDHLERYGRPDAVGIKRRWAHAF
jgi:hypothetical protein